MRRPCLGRSLTELLATVALLKERGIAPVSLEERIDTGSATGEPVFHMFGAIAHYAKPGMMQSQASCSAPIAQ